MAIALTGITGLAIDSQGLANLKLRAKTDSDQSLPQVAKQLEGLFLNMMLKSMREALPQEDAIAGDATKLYNGMLDGELVQRLAERGTGLADVIVKQISAVRERRDTAFAGGINATVTSPPTQTPVSSVRPAGLSKAATFVRDISDEAQHAASVTGVPAKFMIGQAALESGWGKREIRHADGSPSFNVFAIKAGKNWAGATVDVLTTEYVGGVPQKVVQKFRSYDSYAEAFVDYGNLITKNPRYGKVLAHGDDPTSFARALQQAGYATDPRYAEKLVQVMNHSALKQTTA